MKKQLHKKSVTKTTKTAAAHQRKGKMLEDNRPASIIQQKKNNTGLPDNLKSGMENLSGHSLDDVKVHYNSSKPAQLNAHAYAQGTNIHLASGQEKHLAHEAWHVVQQKQGRVQPTKTVNGAKINDNLGLEKEADVMGARAVVTQKKEKRNVKIMDGHAGTIAQLHKKGVFDAGKGDKWHIEFDHIKFHNNHTVNFTKKMTKQQIVAKLRDSYKMTNKQLRALNVPTWIECTKWLKKHHG
ncbi:hypothetical protein KORDIASMS9_01467 [Kordia sp. SMS9]|uniref:eCIS core domain-containing protein n=1 Tax=Kordia sp. SMS9 TaxID=2282170 RepID=UPI000E0D3C87|nr:DUF4157 domain-containing protein [Kordia sp. SMS9]AXG69247.1 hypothetical protein KORDIASMS9_01467 [Kordia sp. SMS9]